MSYKDDMKLPKGKTCSDCINWSGCDMLFGPIENNTECDFYPSRYFEDTQPSQSDGSSTQNGEE